MSTTEERIQALEDRNEINELISLYSLLILQNQASSISELFTDDGIFQTNNIQLEGREQLSGMFERMQPGVTYPLVRPAVITINGNTASHAGVMHSPASGDREGYTGIYSDTLRKVDGRWLFAKRDFSFVQGAPPAR